MSTQDFVGLPKPVTLPIRKRLVIEPNGGLCNRMRVIQGGIAFGIALGRECEIVWNKNSDLNCDFERLFQMPGRVSTAISIRRSKLYLKFRGIYKALSLSHSKESIIDLKRVIARSHQLVEDYKVCQSRCIRIMSCNFPGGTEENAVRLHPVFPLQQRADQLMVPFENVNIVGVHIRGTDNEKAKKTSTIDAFIHRMKGEIDVDSRVKFYLATDEPRNVRIIQKEFGNRVVCFEKRSLNRSHPEAIEDALVDIICLSRTRKLLGSHWSSFSEMAAQMGDIPLDIVGHIPTSLKTIDGAAVTALV